MLRCNEREIVGGTAAVSALPCSCPPSVLARKLENVVSHGGTSIRGTGVLRYDNIVQPRPFERLKRGPTRNARRAESSGAAARFQGWLARAGGRKYLIHT